MQHIKKLFCVLLALALVLAFAGCEREPEPQPTTTVPTTQAPIPTTTAAPTEPPVDPAKLYAEAVDALNGMTELSVIQCSTLEVTVGGETFTTSENHTLSYTGIGTEAMAATATSILNYDDIEAKSEEIYTDGKAYLHVTYGTASFKCQSEMTSEDYAARFMPAALLDAALYASLTHEETGSGYILSFTEATTAESWLGLPEDTVIESAEGTVTLTADKKISASEYSITYAIAGVHYSLSVRQDHYATVVTKEAPSNPDDYLTIGHPDVPLWMIRAVSHLYNAETYSTQTSQLSITAAGGAYLVDNISVDIFGSGADLMAKIEQDISMTDYSTGYGQESTYNSVELFRDGQYTMTVDDGEPQKNSTVTADMVIDYVSTILDRWLPGLDSLTGAELTDLGGSILIEYTLDEEYSEFMSQDVTSLFYNDPDFLNGLASSYKTKTMEGYLALDKYSGLPTALGIDYQASHTIQGQSYDLTQQTDQSFLLASPAAYESITEEISPDAEPDVDPTPLFYKVTGSNGQTMWLLGTIHVGDHRTGHLPQVIYDAFNAADALAVECDTQAFEEQAEEDEEIQGLISALYTYDDGSNTEGHIEDEELYTYALQMMKASGSYNFNTPYFKTHVWQSSLDNFYQQQGYQLFSSKGVDNRLLTMAKDQGKKILEVESNEFQLKMLSGWSEELQEMLLMDTCSVDYPEYCADLMELYEAWLAGDEAVLTEMISDEVDTSEMTEEELAEYEQYKPLIEEYNKAMGPDRNDDMLKVAIEYLESGDTVFYAVGLAHLLAPDGLVNTLRDAGYTVELVSYE